MPVWNQLVTVPYPPAPASGATNWSVRLLSGSPTLTVAANSPTGASTLTTAIANYNNAGDNFYYYNTTAGRDSQIVADIPANGIPGNSILSFIFRSNASSNESTLTSYAVLVDSFNFIIYSIVNGTETLILNTTSISPPIDFTHENRFTISCYGVNPTSFTMQVFDVTTQAIVYDNTGSPLNEGTTSITSTTGYSGIGTSPTGGNPAIEVGTLTIYTGELGAINFGVNPASGSVTQNSVALTGTFGGGTSPYSWTLKSSLTAGSFTGSPIATGTGTSLSYTDSSPLASPGGQVYYQWEITDSTSPTAETAYAWASAVLLNPSRCIGFIGDSITANGVVTGYFASSFALIAPQYPCTISNQAVSGSASFSWLSGGYDLNTAITAFLAAGVTDVMYMIGTNDAQTAFKTSQSAFQSNLANTCAALVTALGSTCRVFLNQPITPSDIINNAQWDDTSGGYLAQYSAAMDALVDNKHIMLGDREGYAIFANNAQVNNFTIDNVHPAGAGGYALSYLWAAAYARSSGILGALPSGGGGGGSYGFVA